jgi:hypothetical protein
MVEAATDSSKAAPPRLIRKKAPTPIGIEAF